MSHKSVQFSRFIKISFTYPGDEYDRSALEPAKLTFSEASELMQLRIDWKQEMAKRVEASGQQQQESEDGYSSDEANIHSSLFHGHSPSSPLTSCAS
ncbi:hypothetical protein BG011_008666 [Mortierella polycephala]|uniref:Uncharacterized protein n=1 Tax=Mortierella polycephala TaxID=41804 RepID=A0A9P6PNJ7_9FUNG|nr:hypothetical protein BG011_008666 [Mortierella polycephala]